MSPIGTIYNISKHIMKLKEYLFILISSISFGIIIIIVIIIFYFLFLGPYVYKSRGLNCY